MHAISDAFDATLFDLMGFMFRFLLVFIGLWIVLFFSAIAWVAGWLRDILKRR